MESTDDRTGPASACARPSSIVATPGPAGGGTAQEAEEVRETEAPWEEGEGGISGPGWCSSSAGLDVEGRRERLACVDRSGDEWREVLGASKQDGMEK